MKSHKNSDAEGGTLTGFARFEFDLQTGGIDSRRESKIKERLAMESAAKAKSPQITGILQSY